MQIRPNFYNQEQIWSLMKLEWWRNPWLGETSSISRLANMIFPQRWLRRDLSTAALFSFFPEERIALALLFRSMFPGFANSPDEFEEKCNYALKKKKEKKQKKFVLSNSWFFHLYGKKTQNKQKMAASVLHLEWALQKSDPTRSRVRSFSFLPRARRKTLIPNEARGRCCKNKAEFYA